MIVAELALEERHGEASKQLKMPHQYSGKFFAKTENKSQNHQNSNLHHLYIAEIVTKLRAIYDVTVWKGIVARFKISDRPFLECTLRDRFSRDPITPQVIYDATFCKDIITRFLKIAESSTAGRRDTAKATLRERSIHDAITQQLRAIYDATVMRSITTRFRNGIASIYIQEAKERDAISDRRDRFFARTQKFWSIYDVTMRKALTIGNAITPHQISSMTERHQDRYIIYDATS